MDGGAQASTVTRLALLIALAALVPLLLFAIFQTGYSAREQRRVLEARALTQSEAVILRADGEVKRLTTLLDALATSGVLRDSDWASFQTRAYEMVRLNPDVARVEVRDATSGAMLFEDGVPASPPIRATGPTVSSRTRFVGYAKSEACLCVLFERSSVTSAGRALVLTLAVPSETFRRLLPPNSEYEVSALSGPAGRFIARSLSHEARFATPGSTYLRSAVNGGQAEGIYRGRTLEGVENYTAFTRSSLTGWTAHLALGSDYLDNPARRYFASLGIAALLSLLLAGVLILFAVRQMMEARGVAERMQQAQKMEALGQLTGGLAHDFNNLLTPVIGVLDQLTRREGLDERGRRLATGALSSALRAAKLTQQLLAFSRRQRLVVGPIDVPALLGSVAELVDRTISGRHSFTIAADPDARCVRSDLTQLELALLNLAINARDAAPEGSVITLRVAHEAPGEGGGEGFVRFAMIDQGSGMDEETRRRALEPFFTTKPTGHGTGLGLAQVFGVVEQSGGTVEIESEVGVGTIVTLRLPACEAEETKVTRASAAQLAQPASRALRLLVVDDDPDVRATVAQMLSEGGHSVDSVSNGRSALASLEMEEFDLVVSDYLMPGMSGAELIAEARRTKPEQPFLIVSGFADSEELMRSCPDTARIGKPFTAAELLGAVERAVG
jgi:signal transduction histidine kinase/CheY-like chemotaxis protein